MTAQIRIVNKDGVSNHTQVFFENDGQSTELHGIDRIVIEPLKVANTVKAEIRFVRVLLDLSTKYAFQKLHNDREFERLNLRRIN